jgi:hypothetical protein
VGTNNEEVKLTEGAELYIGYRYPRKLTGHRAGMQVFGQVEGKMTCCYFELEYGGDPALNAWQLVGLDEGFMKSRREVLFIEFLIELAKVVKANVDALYQLEAGQP